MRELKFRCWDEKRNRYVGDGEVVFKSYGNEAAVVVCPNSQDYIGDICHDEYIDDGRFVIEQYIGLKDENGKEIYEGDIMKYDACLYRVFWDECGFTFKQIGEHGGWTSEDVFSEGKVIGNIHENQNCSEVKND